MGIYDSESYSGHVVREDVSPSSIVVDWTGGSPVDVSGYDADEEVVVYKRTVRTDGYEKGKEIELSMTIRHHRDAPQPEPCVLFIPGGGFFICIPEILLTTQRYLSMQGYAVVAAGYRLVGEGLVSDMLEDIRDALGYIKERASEYNIDPDRIALMGDSASGYLVSLAATKERLDVKAVIDLYGPSDLLRVADDHDEETQRAWHDPRSVLNQIVNGVFSGSSLYDTPDRADEVNPLRYVDGTEPPFLLMQGSEDPEVSPSQTGRLHEALSEKGADSTRYLLRGTAHGGLDFESEDAMDALVSFLSRTL